MNLLQFPDCACWCQERLNRELLCVCLRCPPLTVIHCTRSVSYHPFQLKASSGESARHSKHKVTWHILQQAWLIKSYRSDIVTGTVHLSILLTLSSVEKLHWISLTASKMNLLWWMGHVTHVVSPYCDRRYELFRHHDTIKYTSFSGSQDTSRHIMRQHS